MMTSQSMRPAGLDRATIHRPVPVAKQLVKHLVSVLASGDIAPGQKLPSERQLCELLGVGRSALREALKTLTVLGLLEVRQGDGTYMASSATTIMPDIISWGLMLEDRSIDDLMEARTMLEITIARQAALRRTDANVQQLEDILETMRSSTEDLERYIEADIQFHMCLSMCSGNDVLRDLLTSVRSLLEQWTRRVILSRGSTAFSFAVHEPIFLAVRDGDPDAAELAMRNHMSNAVKHLGEALNTPSVGLQLLLTS